jgi:hypothetical protein
MNSGDNGLKSGSIVAAAWACSLMAPSCGLPD